MSFVTSTAPIERQIGPGSPVPQGLSSVTAPVQPPQNLLFRLRNFTDEVYNLTPTSHLVRFLGVLLGDAGGEQLRKRGLVSRLQTAISGSSFLTLDAFYGALFGLNRVAGESYPTNPATGLPLNPYTDSAMPAVWNLAHQADSYYRSRIFQFAQALSYGPSPVGIKKVAEAVLNVSVDLYETFQSTPANYTATIVPHRVISVGEMYNLHNVLHQIQPADSVITITQGTNTTSNPVTLAQAWADSTYWDVQATVVPGLTSLYTASVNQRQRYAFSAYQGETWELNSEINSITSAAWDFFNTVLATSDFEHFIWPDGSFTNYTPDLAIQPGWQLELGRLASSGITTANPVNNTSDLSPVLMDGMPLTSLASLIQGAAQPNQYSQNHYWSTPARLGTDNTQDVLSISFSQPHLVNQISFQVANFPHTASVYLQDPPSGNWIQAYAYTISTCSPSVIGDTSTLLANHDHPQHSATDSWLTMNLRINPASVQNIQVRLQRFSGIGPHDTIGNALPYSLGVANFAMSYTLDDPGFLPIGGGVLDSTTNAIGDQVSYSTYIEDPNNILNTANSVTSFNLNTGLIAGTAYTSVTTTSPVTLSAGSYLVFGHQQVLVPSAVNNSATIPTVSFTPAVNYSSGAIIPVATSQWRCSPQATSSAVVNLYLDARQNTANNPTPQPQVIDSFYVEPTHAGVTANLYWTNQLPDGQSGPAVDLPMTLQNSGNVTPSSIGLAMAPQNSWVRVPAPHLFNGLTWWVGISFIPSLSQTTYQLLNIGPSINGNSTLKVVNGSIIFDSGQGDNVTLGTITPQQINNVVIGMLQPGVTTDLTNSPTGLMYLGVNGQSVTHTPTTVYHPPGTLFTVGNATGGTPSGFTLTNLVFKGEPLTTTAAKGYMANPRPYCVKGTYVFQDQGLTNNAYVRFDPSFINSTSNTYGFVGGTPDFMANLEWVPLVKDFILTRGKMRFRPTLATFWKIEMTNLVAEPYNLLFPHLPSTTQQFLPTASIPGAGASIYQGGIPTGQTAVQSQASGQPQFQTTRIPSPEPDMRLTSPTTTLVADSPVVTQALASKFPHFGYLDHHQSPTMPVNDSGGTTQYQTSTTGQFAQIAFFCGFYIIQAMRQNPSSQTDPPVIYERFLDQQNYVY